MALILLVVITLVGLAAIGTTLIQNKAASNTYDRQVAFQAAEAALRQAQVTITTDATDATPAPAGIEDCSTPTSTTTPTNTCLANPFADTTNAGITINTVPASAFSTGLAAQQPQYVIQYMGSFLAPPATVHDISNPQTYDNAEMANYYRITARSGNPATVGERSIVTLQSTFRN